MREKIAVLGAGSWGTALAVLLNGNGHDVAMWEHQETICQELIETRENSTYLPAVKISSEIFISSKLSDIINGRSTIVIAVPSHVVREVAQQLRDLNIENCLVVSVAKGIENDTFLRMSQVITKVLRPEKFNIQVGVLSGPSHAEEVGQQMPTSIVAAAVKIETAQRIQEIFINEKFRVYTNTDIVGVELGGSLKNVVALAAGIVDGLGYGDNTKAALLTRGMAEISRLGVALGAKMTTFSGLSGIGDLIVTCTSRHSRNRRLGEMLGQGMSLDEALSQMTMVAEGVKTTVSAYHLARKMGVEIPITNQVYRVLFEKCDPKAALRELMTRDAKSEMT